MVDAAPILFEITRLPSATLWATIKQQTEPGHSFS
jgi:hypothetical protein